VTFAALRAAPHPLAELPDIPSPRSDDFQIALWALQEMSFRPLDSVHRGWENESSLAELRRRLEQCQEAELRAELFQPASGNVIETLEALATGGDGPSLSQWMEDNGALVHMREFVLHRAPYQLKEADAHSFAIPRLPAGRAKSALLKIQLDEYGDTESGESHQELFAATMDAVGVALDIDTIPAVTLRTNTVLNTLGTQRRLLGALLGHLAVFELTSVTPMSRYATTLRRLLPTAAANDAARFFDVHVSADAFHGRIAIEEMIDGFLELYPDEADDVVFGAAAVTAVEGEFSRHLLQSWDAELSSLRNAEPTRAAA
ncbi:MAG: iron-containing redox enzyme family protein, partial [Acidimicrobiales bacterium]|nr:iron-containing redox enzyme family protein [Acidimicrobiales bacterium]